MLFQRIFEGKNIQERNLFDNQKEWEWCMEQAARKDMPHQLRRLYANIILYSTVNDKNGNDSRVRC